MSGRPSARVRQLATPQVSEGDLTLSADPGRSVPAIDFLDSVPLEVRAEIDAVLDAVAEAPPPAFSGGGKWEVMHDEMAGFYEVRVRGADRQNHRLFCVLEREAEDLGEAPASSSSLGSPSRCAKPRTRVTTSVR